MSELENQKKTIRKSVAIFGGIFMAVGLLTVTGTISVYFLGEASRTWPQTNAVILSSEVSKYENRSTGGTANRSISYAPDVVYTYSVKNNNYTNNRVSFSPIGGSNRSRIARYVSRFTIGKSYPVYYNPEKPENSTLIRGTSKLNIAGIFAALAFFLFGFLIYKLRDVYANSIPNNEIQN